MTQFFFQFFHASGHRIQHIITSEGYEGLPWPQTLAKEKKVAKQKKSTNSFWFLDLLYISLANIKDPN